MKLKHDPFPFIFSQGDEETRLVCLDFFGLADSSQGRKCLLSLLKRQRADGAFPSRFDPQEWSTRETVRNALLLLKVGMPSSGVNVDGAVQFLLGQQRPDGGWSENPALEIPSWVVELSNERSVTWLTADVVELFRQVGVGESAPCQAALVWLGEVQNGHGGWHCFRGSIGEQRGTAGDPDSTAQIAFLMGEIYGQDDPAYLKGRELYERSLDECIEDVERGYRVRLRDGRKADLDAYTLTQPLLAWVLEPPRRVRAGYDVREPRIRRILEALIGIQREDGGWRPFWEEESSPLYTVLAIEVLVLSGEISQEDLRDMVGRYAA
jgi:hypothetical protein